MLGDSSGGICLPRRPPRSFSQKYSQPISGSHNSRCSRLKCGWRRDMGKARISSSTRISCTCSTEEKSARSRVECPMVKMVATDRFYWMRPYVHHADTDFRRLLPSPWHHQIIPDGEHSRHAVSAKSRHILV